MTPFETEQLSMEIPGQSILSPRSRLPGIQSKEDVVTPTSPDKNTQIHLYGTHHE